MSDRDCIQWLEERHHHDKSIPRTTWLGWFWFFCMIACTPIKPLYAKCAEKMSKACGYFLLLIAVGCLPPIKSEKQGTVVQKAYQDVHIRRFYAVVEHRGYDGCTTNTVRELTEAQFNSVKEGDRFRLE